MPPQAQDDRSAERPIGRQQIPQQRPDRAVIECYVMDDQEEDGLLRRTAQQNGRAAKDRTPARTAPWPSGADSPADRRRRCRRYLPATTMAPAPLPPHDRDSVFLEHRIGQYRMLLQHPDHALQMRRHRTADGSGSKRDIVGAHAGRQLVQHPEPLLPFRQRAPRGMNRLFRLSPNPPGIRRRCDPFFVRGHLPGDMRRQRRDRWALQHLPRRQLYPKRSLAHLPESIAAIVRRP